MRKVLTTTFDRSNVNQAVFIALRYHCDYDDDDDDEEGDGDGDDDDDDGDGDGGDDDGGW